MHKDSWTFGAILDRNRGVGPGFDLLRILLAGVIFYGHAKWAAGATLATMPDGETAQGAARLIVGGWEGWKRPLQVSYVPAFFALSGFLVSASAMRSRVTTTFLAHRGLRIFPALVVEVTLSALLIGLFVTTLPPGKYFTDPGFFRYFGNVVGWITFALPGVFETNPAAGIVNVNLWTLPAEFDCYLLTALAMATGIFYSRRTMTIIFAGVTTVLIPLNMFTDFAVSNKMLHGHTVTYYFFVGVLFYHWRDRIPYHWVWFAVAATLGYLLQMQHHLVYVAPIFIVYCTLFFGLSPIPKSKLLASGDYSYGIYLYGFPITQAVVAFVPGMRGNGTATLLVAAGLTMIFAVVSWHMIEKPMLRLKKKLPARYFPQFRPAVPATPEGRMAVSEA